MQNQASNLEPTAAGGAATFNVMGIGNAIVDVMSQEGDDFVGTMGLTKGAMVLIDDDRAVELYGAMSETTEASGGSAANTMAGIASFGGRAGFIGKVHDDHLGKVFRADMEATGVSFDVAAAIDGPRTGRSMIVVTPDAQRTMNTSLGAATTLYPEDIDTAAVAASSVLYCEGYIWDIDITKQAIRVAIDAAKAAGQRVSFTLSDSFCVTRHHDEWHELLDGSIDILFGNTDELATLTGTDDFDAGIEAIRGRAEIACITRGAAGSLIITADETIEVPAVPVDTVVDTTGAGDQYAAGVLFGITTGRSLAEAGRLGSAAAAEVISHLGARPLVALSTLL